MSKINERSEPLAEGYWERLGIFPLVSSLFSLLFFSFLFFSFRCVIFRPGLLLVIIYLVYETWECGLRLKESLARPKAYLPPQRF